MHPSPKMRVLMVPIPEKLGVPMAPPKGHPPPPPSPQITQSPISAAGRIGNKREGVQMLRGGPKGSHRGRTARGQRSPRGGDTAPGRFRGGGSLGPPLPKGAEARSTPTPPPWWPPVRQGHRAAPRAAAPADHAPFVGPSGPLRSYQSGPTCRLRPRRHLGRGRGLVCVGGGGGVGGQAGPPRLFPRGTGLAAPPR